MNDSHHIILGLIALLLALFFGGMEIVFQTANKLKIELDKKQGAFGAKVSGFLSQQPRTFIATMLVGQFIALLTFSYVLWQATSTPVHPVWVIGLIIGFLSALFFMLFAEFIPRVLFAHHPNRWLNAFSLPLFLAFILLYPLSIAAVAIGSVIRLFTNKDGLVTEKEAEFGRFDLNEYIEQATGRPDTSASLDHEIEIFRNALDFSSVKARDCLTPRNEIVAIEITDTVQNLHRLFIETGLSKIVVYRQSIDHIIGYVHSFEMFKKPEHIQHILRPVSFIPEPMSANEILELFIREKRHMVVVVDEFGGTSGIITMEDVVEEIFGEIEDEHDLPSPENCEISEGVYEFSARMEIDYLNKHYKLHLPVNNDEYDTLGGLMLYLTGDIPEQNTHVETEGYKLTAVTVNEKRIETIRVERMG
ncbi:MAG TPA: hemolysin family protein [Flavobacteriales bacterium]